MYIKSYSCTRFAGLRDKRIEFNQGLNVILGPNESGKSTIINGIHSTLFKNIRLNRSRTVDTNFIHRYMPKPEGDFIDGSIEIVINEDRYKINKEWGSSESIKLITPEGNIIRDENNANKELSKALEYGEGTYSNIVFAKQRDLKESIINIMENSDLTSEVNSILRKTMMELDGVSIDELQGKIEEELDTVYKKWNRDKNYPENNRGINNPYKIGLGKIVESYYEMEKLRLLMDEADKSERKFEEICEKIRILGDKISGLVVKKESLEKIEGDINKRQVLEEQLKNINTELTNLMKANQKWPVVNLLLKQYEEELTEIDEKEKELEKEKNNVSKLDRKKSLKKDLEKLREIDLNIKDIEEKLLKIPKVTDQDIDKITEVQRKVLTLNTQMEAGSMIGVLKKGREDELWIKKGFKERERLGINEEFKAKGIINISYKDEFELEIKTGDFDFDKLKEEYEVLLLKEREVFEKIKVESIEEARDNLRELDKLESHGKNLEKDRERILEGRLMEELLKEMEELEEIKDLRSMEEIEEELGQILDEKYNILVNKKTNENQIREWEENYQNEESLLDILIEKRSQGREKEKELEGLSLLPEEFSTPDEFRRVLSSIKDELEANQELMIDLREEYHMAKNQLLDISYEEIKRSYIDAKNKFNRNVNHGEKLLEVRRVFMEVKENLDNNPMESLVKEFTRVLSIITNNRYKSGEIDENFNIKLENPMGEIPIDLLSAGTYDSVALALRFSLLKHIFQDRRGYVVLDDCLVDLDPARKEESINLIKDFAKENQVIFTTCDPETARLLGGSIVELEY